MLIEQDISGAMASAVGASGLPEDVLDGYLERAESVLDWLRTASASDALPLLSVVRDDSDLAGIGQAAEWLGAGEHAVFLGTGGSSLGGQCLAQVTGWSVQGIDRCRGSKLHFLDNLDPVSFAVALEALPLERTRFLAISKSGGTAETLIQVAAVLAALREAKLDPADRLMGLTEPDRAAHHNALRNLLVGAGCTVHDHIAGLGGRFAGLSNVGLIPAALAGLDIAAARRGAAAVLADLKPDTEAKDFAPAVGAALAVGLAQGGGATVNVMMAYSDRLECFTRWWVQLWGESLGKSGHGMTPVAAIGPVDQHSQLQLYLDGPADKFVTVAMADTRGTGPRLDAAAAEAIGFPAMAGKTVGDFVWAQQTATADTLQRHNRPVRRMLLKQVDAATLGALMMHFMLETIVAAHLLGVDAFDQPAVEAGKVLARTYLAGEETDEAIWS